MMFQSYRAPSRYSIPSLAGIIIVLGAVIGSLLAALMLLGVDLGGSHAAPWSTTTASTTQAVSAENNDAVYFDIVVTAPAPCS